VLLPVDQTQVMDAAGALLTGMAAAALIDALLGDL
jgi:hypothetical protein